MGKENHKEKSAYQRKRFLVTKAGMLITPCALVLGTNDKITDRPAHQQSN